MTLLGGERGSRGAAGRRLGLCLVLSAGLAGAASAGIAYDDLMASGWEARRSGRQEDAVEAFGAVLGEFPNDSDARVGRGFSFLALGDLGRARLDFQRAVQVAPSYLDAWRGLAAVARAEDNVEAEREAWDGLVAQAEDDPAGYLRRSEFLASTGDPVGARRDLMRALVRGAPSAEVSGRLRSLESGAPIGVATATVPDPGPVGPRAASDAGAAAPDVADAPSEPAEPGTVAQARERLDEGDAAGALAILDGILAEYPDNVDAHLFRGFALLRQGEKPEAEAAFRRVVEEVPGYGDAWLGLGIVLAQRRRNREALEALDKALETQPENSDIHIERGKVLNSLGRPGDSGRALREARRHGASRETIERVRADIRRGAYGRYWQAQVYYENLDWDSRRSDWYTRSVLLNRKVEGGTTGLEYRSVTRFNRRDESFGLDLYRNLWAGAYGNFRVDYVSDSSVLPKLEYRTDIFQDVGKGWEVSLGFGLREVPGEDVRNFRFQLGRYVDEWYLRYRLQLTPIGGTTGSAHAFVARRFLGSVDHFVEATVGFGEEPVTIAPGPVFVRRDNDYGVLRYQRFKDQHLGFFAVASIAHYDLLPDFKGLVAGLMYRWW